MLTTVDLDAVFKSVFSEGRAVGRLEELHMAAGVDDEVVGAHVDLSVGWLRIGFKLG